MRGGVCIIVKNYGPQRCEIGCELCQMLIHVENDGDGDDENNGIDIGSNELGNDVSVDSPNISKRIEK